MIYREYLPKQQTLMLLLFLVPVLVVLDWRLNSETKALTQGDLIPDLPIQQMISDTVAKTELPSIFTRQLDTSTEQTPISAEGLSADAQLQQQGLLNKLYIGTEVFRLRGIIQRDGVTALLQVEDLQGVTKRRLELKAGDELPPYQVVNVNQRRILLQHGERQLWLQLFVPHRALDADASQP